MRELKLNETNQVSGAGWFATLNYYVGLLTFETAGAILGAAVGVNQSSTRAQAPFLRAAGGVIGMGLSKIVFETAIALENINASFGDAI